jgi:hypothetical protein
MISERKDRIDIIYEDADSFRLTNWLIIIGFHLLVVILGIVLSELSIDLPKFTPIILPPVFVICGYILFSKIYTVRKVSLTNKYDKKELAIFFKRSKSFSHYKRNYFISAAGVIFVVFLIYTKYIEYDTLNNGELIKYGTITDLRTSRGRSVTHNVYFSFQQNRETRNGWTEVYKFYEAYRSSYGYPLNNGDKYAVIARKENKIGAEMYFELPSQETINKIRQKLENDFPKENRRIYNIEKHFGYKGLIAYYHWKNPGFLQKINSEKRKELKKIMDNDKFEYFLRN